MISRPIVEFQLLWYERFEWLPDEVDHEAQRVYGANGWMRAEEKSLPKTLNDLGAQGWEIAHCEEGRVLLRRSRSRSEAGYSAMEYYALALPAHVDGTLGVTSDDSQEEYEAGGWNFVDATPGGLGGKLNGLGAQGWNLVAWTQDFVILWRPKAR